jgi:hypothetical protein
MGSLTLTLRIEKPGFKPTTKKLHSKSAIDRMTVELARYPSRPEPDTLALATC